MDEQHRSLRTSANLFKDTAIVQGRRNVALFPNRTQVLLQDFGHRIIVEPIKKRIPMKEEKYTDNELFDLSVLVGNWESVNLHPTVIIYRNGNTYLLSLIHINETSKQANPATYEIQEDEDGYFISYNLKRLSIDYDARLDMLKLSLLGDYMRN
jgi:hypothetical protein